MSVTVDKLRAELANLSEADRAELAHFLIHSLDTDNDSDAEAAWNKELIQRAEDIRHGRVTGEPATKVFAELRAKHS